jgi:hypothetical protein
MPLLRHARIAPCKKLRRLTLVGLQNTTVLIFYDVNTKTQVSDVELISHDCDKVDETGAHEVGSSCDFDEEEIETREKPERLPGSLPVNKEVKRKAAVAGLVAKVKGCLKAPRCGMLREAKKTHDDIIGGGNDTPAITGKPVLIAAPSNESKEQAPGPALDYLKIESCDDLKLYPYIPMCKEYFIKKSSLDVKDIQQYDMLHSTPTFKSKI